MNVSVKSAVGRGVRAPAERSLLRCFAMVSPCSNGSRASSALQGGALWLALATAPALAEPVWLSGEVRALEAEGILVPPSNSSPVVLRYLVPEGSLVEPGDVLVRIDPGESASQVRQLEAQIALLEATVARDLAALAVTAIDAERALVEAEAALAKARVDAGIPRQHLSALDFDRYRGEFERAEREAALKRAEWQAATAAVDRKRADARLELDKLRADLAYHQAQLGNAEQRAERRGRVVYGFDPWRGTRYEEGASAYPGHRVGEVVGDGGVAVRAYALEPDRAGLAEGQPVQLVFDALPGQPASGRIERIGGAPDTRAQWGDGRYFTLDITLDDAAAKLPLLPGMSVRVEVAASTETAP
jgi:HlyD family secretion protein